MIDGGEAHLSLSVSGVRDGSTRAGSSVFGTFAGELGTDGVVICCCDCSERRECRRSEAVGSVSESSEFAREIEKTGDAWRIDRLSLSFST